MKRRLRIAIGGAGSVWKWYLRDLKTGERIAWGAVKSLAEARRDSEVVRAAHEKQRGKWL